MSDPRMNGDRRRHAVRRQAHDLGGGFATLIDDGAGTKPGYVDGATRAGAERQEGGLSRPRRRRRRQVFNDHGAIRVVEAWGDDVPDGKVTDYKEAR